MFPRPVTHHAPGEHDAIAVFLLAISATGDDQFLEFDHKKWTRLPLEKFFKARTFFNAKILWGIAVEQFQAGRFIGWGISSEGEFGFVHLTISYVTARRAVARRSSPPDDLEIALSLKIAPRNDN
jgi:hypothetical protein